MTENDEDFNLNNNAEFNETVNQEPTVAETKSNDLFANLAFGAGWASFGADMLVIFGMHGFDLISLILEVTAIGTGLIALALKQDRKKATTGITLGLIGVAIRLFFGTLF